ncbi:MAG: 30S ribosomal protein S5 [Candidatus Saccharimonadales bacterium]
MLDDEKQGLDERVVSIDRVTRVVKGGRRFRFRALVVVGDNEGSVGAAVAKGSDVATSVSKASGQAAKNMKKITLRDGTIPHEVQAKHSGANVLLKPAGPGTGVIAGGAVREVLLAAGVSDILSKSLGSSNKINCTYATLKALDKIIDVDPKDSLREAK